MLRGYVGGKADSLSLRLYADADFSGDRPEFKSTSGVFLALIGDNTCFPLCAKSAKQTCVAHSTVEAEMVAANTGVRTVGIPSLDLWESVLKRHVVLNLIEDNESTYQIIKTGKNPTMRHLTRTHGVHVSWLHDLWERNIFGVTYTRTEAQCADVFTKTFGDVVKWQGAIELIGMAPGGTPPKPPPEPGPRPEKDNKSSTKNGGQSQRTPRPKERENRQHN